MLSVGKGNMLQRSSSRENINVATFARAKNEHQASLLLKFSEKHSMKTTFWRCFKTSFVARATGSKRDTRWSTDEPLASNPISWHSEFFFFQTASGNDEAFEPPRCVVPPLP